MRENNKERELLKASCPTFINEEDCHARRRERLDWDSLPVFFFSELNLYLWVYK